MVDAYDELGMYDLRDDAKRVMQKSFSKNQESLATTNLDSISWNSGKKYWWKFW